MKVPKRVWVSVLVVISVGLTVTGALALWHHSQQVAEKRRQTEQALTNAKKLDVGGNRDSNVTYYTNLAGAYFNAGEYEKALENFQKADERIADRSANGTSVNLSIATVYVKLGDKENARNYYERELKRIKGSDNSETEKYIRNLEAQL